MMIVKTIIIKLYAPWVHSLKEKRGIVKSICSKVSNKFNVSIAEVDEQKHTSNYYIRACLRIN